MYQPLAQLEQLNAKCRIHLTKLLSSRHGIGISSQQHVDSDAISRGSAFFAAFDPWDTCWRVPPGSVGYFDIAEKTGLIGAADASLLSKTLVKHGAELSIVYDGWFSSFFREHSIETILGEVHNLEHLLASGLAVGRAWVDRLYELSPLPLLPEKHLESQSFRDIALAGEVEFYSQTPWLAWAEALDLICFGPWLGLQPQEIIQMLRSLREITVDGKVQSIHVGHRVLGKKIIIPFFSNGLQGAVFGFFHRVPQEQTDLMYTTLLQFGQTLADAYARLRMHKLTEALNDDLDLEELARELIYVVSPVKKIVVSKNGAEVGYALAYEHNYWSGYHKLERQALKDHDGVMGFTVEGPDSVAIYIEPLTNVPNFHHQFTHIRVEACLRQCFGVSTAPKVSSTLEYGRVQQHYAELGTLVQEKGASLAKLRQFYIVSKMQMNWKSRRLRITNMELKRYLERELGKEIKNGYQITSYGPEIERMFDHKVAVEKTRNALTLSWSTGA